MNSYAVDNDDEHNVHEDDKDDGGQDTDEMIMVINYTEKILTLPEYTKHTKQKFSGSLSGVAQDIPSGSRGETCVESTEPGKELHTCRTDHWSHWRPG